MSTDKLASVINKGWWHGRTPTSEGAADAVREAFVVIDRNGLPEVVEGRYARVRYGDGTFGHVAAGPNDDPEWHEAKARLHLAVAEHLRANPPVDEKAVDELQDALIERIGQNAASRALAKSLVADGWKRETTP